MSQKENILNILKSLVKKSPKNLKRDYETLQVRLQEVLDEIRDTRTEISKLEERVQTAESERDEIKSSYQGKIKKYKEEKLKDMNQRIYAIIDEASKKVINKSLDLAAHEEIVLEALEKARKENLF